MQRVARRANPAQTLPIAGPGELHRIIDRNHQIDLTIGMAVTMTNEYRVGARLPASHHLGTVVAFLADGSPSA